MHASFAAPAPAPSKRVLNREQKCVEVESVALVYVDTGGVSLLDAGAVTA